MEPVSGKRRTARAYPYLPRCLVSVWQGTLLRAPYYVLRPDRKVRGKEPKQASGSKSEQRNHLELVLVLFLARIPRNAISHTSTQEADFANHRLFIPSPALLLVCGVLFLPIRNFSSAPRSRKPPQRLRIVPNSVQFVS